MIVTTYGILRAMTNFMKGYLTDPRVAACSFSRYLRGWSRSFRNSLRLLKVTSSKLYRRQLSHLSVTVGKYDGSLDRDAHAPRL